MSKEMKITALASLFLAGSFLLEFKQKAAFGWSFDFILAALVVLPLFLDFSEFIFFGVLAFLLLKLAYPWSGLEAALLIFLPSLAFIFKKIFPWQSWLEPFLAVFLAITVFYSAANPGGFFGDVRFLVFDLAVSMIFGWVMYYFLAFAGERNA